MDGLQLKIRRLRAGIRQYRLAAELGIPQSKLSCYENSRRRIPPGMHEKILAAIEELRHRRSLGGRI